MAANGSFTRHAKNALRSITPLLALKRALLPNADGKRGSTRINLLRSFPAFIPYSHGSYRARASLTVQAIDQLLPTLAFAASQLGHAPIAVQSTRQACRDSVDLERAKALGEHFERQGSDKTRNQFHFLYAALLGEPAYVTRIFEVGLGTNSTDVVSTMGHLGRPGASLRAFRDYCPSALVHGADIDRRILFNEERIRTYFVDQTKRETFSDMRANLGSNFDLVIDDGLHSPHANLEAFCFALDIVRPGGWVVIEDIGRPALPLWQIVAALLPTAYQVRLYEANGSILFAVSKTEEMRFTTCPLTSAL